MSGSKRSIDLSDFSTKWFRYLSAITYIYTQQVYKYERAYYNMFVSMLTIYKRSVSYWYEFNEIFEILISNQWGIVTLWLYICIGIYIYTQVKIYSHHAHCHISMSEVTKTFLYLYDLSGILSINLLFSKMLICPNEHSIISRKEKGDDIIVQYFHTVRWICELVSKVVRLQ